MKKLFLILLNFLCGLWQKRQVEKNIEVKKYTKYEDWEKEYYELKDEHKEFIHDSDEISAYLVQAFQDFDDDRIAKYRSERNELHAARDNCYDRIIEHNRRKPPRR